MTLSVCCLTSDPGARVAAILRQLRPVSDEIVVAVDSRLDPHRLGRYAEVADRLLRYEFVDSAEQAAFPGSPSQCTGDWILRIDGDEVVSPTLIERLPELTSARDVFQYWLPCRWLFPDAETLPGPAALALQQSRGWCATTPPRCGMRGSRMAASSPSSRRSISARASTTCRCSSTTSHIARPRSPTI